MEADLCRDAIVVLPGIMGSELVDTGTGRTLWGLSDLGWYVRSWTHGGLDALALTDDERDGRLGRVQATRLLRFPAFAPFLRGFEPYTDLLNGLQRIVPHRDAIIEFPYDWRLSVAHNAGELARACEAHLDRWRRHPLGSPDAKLALVAHSMGGLVARYFTTVLGGAPDVRTLITLGTPYYGSVKATLILSSGAGTPLPARRLRALARTLPGVHDLLPSYRCLDEGSSARRLTVSDVESFGGDRDLATESFDYRARLLSGPVQDVHALVGVEQPTAQSMLLRDGVVEAAFHICEDAPDGGVSRVDRSGDSTVYREAAALPGLQAHPLPQRHGSIARTPEAIAFVRAILTRRELGPPLAAERAVRMDVPDVVTVGEPFDVQVPGARTATGIRCVVETADTARPVAHPDLVRRDDGLAARVTLRSPGVYRVQVKGGGTSAVSDLVLAIAAG